jgi:hypothetical protein
MFPAFIRLNVKTNQLATELMVAKHMADSVCPVKRRGATPEMPDKTSLRNEGCASFEHGGQ